MTPAEMAARLGQMEAEVADLRLQLEEGRARELRLRQMIQEATSTPAAEATNRSAATTDDLEQLRVREQLDLYTSYWVAIQRSRGWRALQFLRGLVGRRW